MRNAPQKPNQWIEVSTRTASAREVQHRQKEEQSRRDTYFSADFNFNDQRDSSGGGRRGFALESLTHATDGHAGTGNRGVRFIEHLATKRCGSDLSQTRRSSQESDRKCQTQ